VSSSNARVVIPGLLLVALGGAWLVMPSVDTGPDIDAMPVRNVARAKTKPPGLKPVSSKPLAEAKEAAPSAPVRQDKPLARRDRPAQPMAAVRASDMQGGLVGGDREYEMMAKRAQRVSQRFHDAGFKARDMMGWDDTTYRAVTTRLDAAEQQLNQVRRDLDEGILDNRGAAEKIVGVQEETMDDVAGMLDEESATLMRRQLGMVVADIEAEEAWEGIPFEEWPADMEAKGDWGDWTK
jgi:hypothetical protein